MAEKSKRSASGAGRLFILRVGFHPYVTGQLVELPDALSVGADYGLTVIAGASPEASRFAAFILSSAGQRILEGYGFGRPRTLGAADLSLSLPVEAIYSFRYLASAWRCGRELRSADAAQSPNAAVWRRRDDPRAAVRACGRGHRRDRPDDRDTGQGRAYLCRRSTGVDLALYARTGPLVRLDARERAGAVRIPRAGRLRQARGRAPYRPRQHREPRGRARAQARPHPRRRHHQRHLHLARRPRAGADRHSLCAARRPLRRDRARPIARSAR